VYYVCSIVVLSIFLKNIYALFHLKGLKLTFGIIAIIFASGGAFVTNGLTDFFIEKVYSGFVINLVLMGVMIIVLEDNGENF